jgi:membrane protease YdiL (CAAX protease family)
MTTVNAVISTKRNPIARYPLQSFFTLAIVFGWLVALPSLVLDLPFKPFQTVGAYGPLLAAVIVTAAQGGESMKALARRATNFRFGFGWYFLAMFGYVALYLLVAGISGAPLRLSLTENWQLLITIYLPAMFTTYLINAIGEEVGWTGFALNHLQMRYRPWLAATVLGVLTAVWHLPAYFVPSEMGAFNLLGFIIFTLQVVLTRMIWTWATNHAHGSAVIAILLHASSNAVSLALIPQLLPTPTPDQMAQSGLILLGLLLFTATVLMVATRGRLGYR